MTNFLVTLGLVTILVLFWLIEPRDPDGAA